jgi:hypothetical protein
MSRSAEAEQVILKFVDKYMGGEPASVVGVMQVTWYPYGQWATERLDPTSLILGDTYKAKERWSFQVTEVVSGAARKLS